MSVSNQRCAGIDVSKGTLDIAISNIASQFTVPNELTVLLKFSES
jgi:transposase